MIIKSVVQLFAVILSKTVAYSSREAFGFIYSGYLAAYATTLIKFKAFNYGIANLWLVITIYISAYGELLYAISVVSTFPGGDVLAALVVGVILIGIVGYAIQSKKCASYLYTEATKPLPEFFKKVPQDKYKERENSGEN